MKHIILGLALLTGFAVNAQCNEEYQDYIEAKAAYNAAPLSNDTQERIALDKAKAAYKECRRAYNEGQQISLGEYRAMTRFDMLPLEGKIRNVATYKRIGIVLAFTGIGSPVGAFLLVQANVRQDKINKELLNEARRD